MVLTKIKTMHGHVIKELKKDKWDAKQKWVAYPKVAFDLIRSIKKYGLHPDEYLLLNFYHMDRERRKKIITRKERDAFVTYFNHSEDLPKLEEKVNFMVNFKEYINRDFLILEESNYDDFLSFLSKHSNFIAKQSDSGQGKGVELVTDILDPQREYKRLKEESFDLIEEVIDTHPSLKKLSPNGTPPIRVFTFIDEHKKPHIIFSAINLSTHNPIVNFGSGALKSLIDPETGLIVADGIDKNNHLYTSHPVTGVPIKGQEIPEWDNLRESVLKAALEFPEVRYIGWDCTISSKGATIIEANAKRPGINGQQMEGYKKADETYANFELVRDAFKRRKLQA